MYTHMYIYRPSPCMHARLHAYMVPCPHHGIPPWYTPEILVMVVTSVSKVQESQGWAPRTRDLRECCRF